MKKYIVGTHQKRLAESKALLMNTHNIGFHFGEELLMSTYNIYYIYFRGENMSTYNIFSLRNKKNFMWIPPLIWSYGIKSKHWQH